MAFTKITADVENISKLKDRPNLNSGLSAAQLKGKFDLGAKDTKTFINESLIPELESIEDGSSGADNIGSTPLKEGGADSVRGQLNELKTASDVHIEDADNPHGVTKAQVGLGDCDNTSDLDKSISIAAQTEFNKKVNNTGNETIAGIKTFSSPPIVPDPTADTQTATKKYVDDLANARYTKTNLQTSGQALVHWENLTNVPNLADDHWKTPVATQADLPVAGNELGDNRVVLDDGDGKQAVYTCVAIAGTYEEQWSKIADVDWMSEEATRQTQELARVSAEGSADPKSGRIGAEIDRVLAENTRILAEGTAIPRTGRIGAELDREDAEFAREAAELLRQAHITDKDNPHEVTAEQVGLGNADNTSDALKPLSIAATVALANKVDKVDGKGLSANDYTDDDKFKLAGIEAGAEVNPDIADNLTTTIAGKVLDARQGKELKDLLTDLPTGRKVARFVVGTSTTGWTAADCDYLCDGTADDVEINNAITALPATGGEIVILDGTYNITATIDVTKDNVNIRGNGNATILKRMYNSPVKEGVITLTSRSGCKIANLQIEGNKTIYNNSNNHGIYLGSSSNNNTITGNTCNNNTAGIYLNASSDNIFTGNTCNNNNSYGIYLSYSSDNNTVTGNTCNNNSYGIFLSWLSSNIFTGNTCNNNNYGIYLNASSSNIFTGNTCNNNTAGIYLNASSNNTVTGNTCTRGTGLPTDYTASQYTIQLAGIYNNYNLISNNNCMGKAPMVDGGTGNCVYGNKYDSGDYKDFTQDEKTKLAGIEAVLEEIVVVGKTAPDFGIWLEEV